MSHEMVLRQRAVRFRQAGWAVSWICQPLERSRDWFYKWWDRYGAEGAAGLRDHSHAPHTNPAAWGQAMRQAIVSIRDRLMRRGPRER